MSSDGRGPSVWDSFSKIEGKIAHGDNGDIADDSYNKMYEDIQLIKNMGINAYRFSISWSRVMPTGTGQINYVAIAHYNRFINALLEINVQPVVTLYHWDMPQGLEDSYGGAFFLFVFMYYNFT